MRPANNASVAMLPTSIEQMSKADLAKLKKDTQTVTLMHRPKACDQPRILKEQIPVALAKAFSGYCNTNIAVNTASGLGRSIKSSTLTITGGAFAPMKEVMDFWFKFCDNKNFIPLVKGPPFHYWVKVHQAAEILQVDVLSGIAMVEAHLVAEKPLAEADARAVIQSFAVGHRYNTMVLENLADAFFDWHSEYDLGGDLMERIKKDYEAFFKALHKRIQTQLQEEEELRLQSMAEEEEKRRKEEEAEAMRVAAEQEARADAEAARKAARATSFAGVASRSVVRPSKEAKVFETALARSTPRPRLVSSAKTEVTAPEKRKMDPLVATTAAVPNSRTWAAVASRDSK